MVCGELKDKITEFRRGWKKATPHQQKQLVRAVIEKLIPSKDGLLVYFRGLEDEQNGTKVAEISADLVQKNAVGSDLGGEPRGSSTTVEFGAP